MISNIFKSTLPSVSYFFKNGVQAPFINHKFITSNKDQITELTEEVNIGHPHIYIDPKESTIDSEALTPIELIKKQAKEEAIAELKAAMNKDAGTSTNTNFANSLANSNSIAQGGVADSTSTNEVDTNTNALSQDAATVTAKLTTLLTPKSKA
jgi:hypothetical protein